MPSLNNTRAWLRNRRTDPLAAPLLQSEGGPSSYLGLAVPAAGEHGADIAHDGERDLTVVQCASTVSLAPHTGQLHNGHPSHSDFSVQRKGLLPAPVLQSDSTGFNAPRSAHMESTKWFMMQELDGPCASAPLAAYCFMTGFVYVTAIPLT